jgi:hypothetical protein
VRSFEFNVDIAATPSEVQSVFWDLKSWPSVAPHVRAMHVHYDDGVVQVVTMDVLTRGHETSFKSVRLRGKNSIMYIQPEPPPALTLHKGSWTFLDGSKGTTVICRHDIEVNTEPARAFLAAANLDVPRGQVEEVMEQVIRSNSLQTIQALKKKVETQRSGDYAAVNLQVA